MTKTQKIIVLIAAALIIVAFLFPPYWEPIIGEDGKISGKYTKWEFNRNIRDLLSVAKMENRETTAGGIQFGLIPMVQYLRRDDLLVLVIFGILVLPGAGLLITNKPRKSKGDQ